MIRDRRIGYRGPVDRHTFQARNDNALYVTARKERVSEGRLFEKSTVKRLVSL